ncbi:MAG: hypothetical protein ACMXX7_00750 [Candidatus Woesearchaeota archaeon]
MKLKKNDLNKGLAYLFVAIGVLVLVISATNLLSAQSDLQPQPQPQDASDLRTVIVDGQTITPQQVQARQLLFLTLGVEANLAEVKEEMITESVLLREARNRGYEISQEEALEELEMTLAFSGLTVQDLVSDLEETGVLYQDFVDYYKNSVVISEMIQDEISNIEVTQQEINLIIQEQGLDEETASQIALLNKQQEQLDIIIEELKSNAQIVYQ